ncbi:hypothetical protein CHS0354_000733 [Potamilus streckersoni]|uniref:Methionyl-tRNA formyltransferase, mitochondrial n=1 Tax=Potamilus streckersoni TaxID=2493646 RepID=A0AAE0T760_9BIVA|nr:hypothetical protein CHS0354_000733 [Potamilus streckersoni]
MGTPAFSVPSLEKIVECKNQLELSIPLVVTSLDKPRRNRRGFPQPTPVKAKAISLGIPVFEVEDLKSSYFFEKLRDIKPDVIIVVAFRILPKEVFSIPTKGIFNLHASLLPKYRGAAPIQWAIINGDKATGVTTFFLEEKVDVGSIILQHSLDVLPNESGSELSLRLSQLGANAVIETLEKIKSNKYELTAQNPDLATKAPKLTKENTKINWNQPAIRVHNFIRALSERPTAWTLFNKKQLKIFRSALVTDTLSTNTANIGEWRIEKNRIFVTCQNKSEIEICELQMEGKNRMTANEFAKGARLSNIP